MWSRGSVRKGGAGQGARSAGGEHGERACSSGGAQGKMHNARGSMGKWVVGEHMGRGTWSEGSMGKRQGECREGPWGRG